MFPGTTIRMTLRGSGDVIKVKVVSEISKATHLGLLTNEGFTLLDPLTRVVTGMGAGVAANGDALRWVYCGNTDASVDSDGAVYFCGGTERFEAATGGFEVEVQARTPDSDDPRLTHLDYTGNGIIRY